MRRARNDRKHTSEPLECEFDFPYNVVTRSYVPMAEKDLVAQVFNTSGDINCPWQVIGLMRD